MRGRIQLALTSVTVIAGSAIAYHFMDHNTSAPRPEAISVTALSPSNQPAPVTAATPPAQSTPVQISPAHPVPVRVASAPAAVKPVKHPLSAVMSTLGMASFYADSFDGRRTANGETFNQKLMTACHKTLPFGTLVRVINVATGRSVIVRINDRGILTPSRVIDLSHAAANEIGMIRSGVAKVRLEILGKAKAVESDPL